MSDSDHYITELYIEPGSLPVTSPEMEHERHSGISHWINERVAAVALLPIIPAAIIYPNAVLDNLLVSAMMLHTHWYVLHGPHNTNALPLSL